MAPSAAVIAADRPSLPIARIAIVGASVSAGFGGTPFEEMFRAALPPSSTVEGEASAMLFQDPIGRSHDQISAAIEFRATTIVALDFLFWDVYGSPDPAWRDHAIDLALNQLDRAREHGAWIVVGDVPLVTTAAEWMLAPSNVPAPEDLRVINDRIARWAARDAITFVPFASWAEPLAADGDVELAPGEVVPARSLVALDGLHANPLGTWYLLDRLDHWIEAKLPGTASTALVFRRP